MAVALPAAWVGPVADEVRDLEAGPAAALERARGDLGDAADADDGDVAWRFRSRRRSMRAAARNVMRSSDMASGRRMVSRGDLQAAGNP